MSRNGRPVKKVATQPTLYDAIEYVKCHWATYHIVLSEEQMRALQQLLWHAQRTNNE